MSSLYNKLRIESTNHKILEELDHADAFCDKLVQFEDAHQSYPPDSTSEMRPGESNNMRQQDAITILHRKEHAGRLGSFGSVGDHTVHTSNFYTSPQAQTFYYGGYEKTNGEWDEYPPYANAEGLEIVSPGVLNENPSLVFHPGYSYNPQMPYGPYSPTATPFASVGGEGQLYSPQQFPFTGPSFYQQLMPPGIPFSPTQVSQPEFSSLANVDPQVENMFHVPRPGYPPQLESFGRANFLGNPQLDMFLAPRAGGIWSDRPILSDRHRPLTAIAPAVYPQPIDAIGPFGQHAGLSSQHSRLMHGVGLGSNSYYRPHMNGSVSQRSTFGDASFSSFGTNNQGWLSIETNRRRGGGNFPTFDCNSTSDVLNEQNRGPRASKPKSQISTEKNSSADDYKHSKSDTKLNENSYNRPDFTTDYEDAKFFIIKSYTEDNVHKSIKYGVWASTINGNKKLDASYREAKKEVTCPIFLLFSVNASAQFCGVAEMVGPVDFDQSVDYWQQDKWNGQFPVKWHMIKDVPNSLFRHIVLENNDNKPATNSRDTQEVKLDQGIEMLNIFKSHQADTSILDDFKFYEDRQKTMEERKRQQANLTAVGIVSDNDYRNSGPLSSNLVKQMSKTFAQVVHLNDVSKDGATSD